MLKKIFIIIIALFGFFGCTVLELHDGGKQMVVENINITKLPHDGFKIFEQNKYTYIDPFQLSEENEKADLILVTHGHYDHCSVEDIKKIVQLDTVIVATPDCISKLSKLEVKEIRPIKPGDNTTIFGFGIEAVSAYNIGKQFHPKENDWVGYVLTINNKRIYHAGDTDRIPEMKELKNIDIALMPVSGTYVMTVEEAAKACDDIKPKVAIPMHYGSIVGSKTDAQKFKDIAKCKVEILE